MSRKRDYLPADYDIFRAAHEGDFAPLVELLRSSAKLTPDRRALVIKILEGKLNRPRHRQESLKTRRRYQAISKRVAELVSANVKQMSAVRQAKEEFRCSETTIRNALRDDRLGQKALSTVQEVSDTLHRLITSDVPKEAARGKKLLRVALCGIDLLLEEKMQAAGLTYERREYPADILAEARALSVSDILGQKKNKRPNYRK